LILATAAAGVFALVTVVLVPGWAVAGPAAPTAEEAWAAVDALPPTPNTAWGMDPATGQLVVTVSDAAPAAGAARMLDVARQFGRAVRVERTAKPIVEQYGIVGRDGILDPSSSTLFGGDEISDGKIICSAGFNVVSDGQAYLLTAGHCTAGMPDWQGVGPSVVSAFPKTDYGLVRNDTTWPRGDVDLYDGTVQPITSVGTATVGEQVCASGQTTQVTCGRVLAVNQTVDYGNGDVVRGLIKTSVHTDHGDSGGPLYHGSTGLGTVSGGDGTTDYFQPLGTALAAYGLDLAVP
jgi:streptogrisin D